MGNLLAEPSLDLQCGVEPHQPAERPVERLHAELEDIFRKAITACTVGSTFAGHVSSHC